MNTPPVIPSTWSIHRLVLTWLLVGMTLVFSANLLSSYFSTREAADSAYDRLLLASAAAIAEHVSIRGQNLQVDIPYAALSMLASTAQDRVFYGVFDIHGRLVTGYDDLPPPPRSRRANSTTPVFFNAQYKNTSVRAVTVKSFVTERDFSGYATITVAQTTGERDALTFDLIRQSTIWAVAIAVLGAIAAWAGISVGLRPLNRLREALDRRSPEDVRPVLHSVPQEFKPLVAALNEMLARLDVGLKAMRRFLSDASHQLKTPLAGLQAQTELAQREEDPEAIREALRKVDISVRRTSRLAQQLLSHARAMEPARTFAPVDLAGIARESVSFMDSQAVSRNIDLGYEGGDSAALTGDRTLLGEMTLNLIDNALRYCPEGSVVTVSVVHDDTAVFLKVEDNGPGIPKDKRGPVFDRFMRLEPGTGEGCGLGLAIVKEIAEIHGGRVSLGDMAGGGLLVTVTFPLVPEAGAQ